MSYGDIKMAARAELTSPQDRAPAGPSKTLLRRGGYRETWSRCEHGGLGNTTQCEGVEGVHETGADGGGDDSHAKLYQESWTVFGIYPKRVDLYTRASSEYYTTTLPLF